MPTQTVEFIPTSHQPAVRTHSKPGKIMQVLSQPATGGEPNAPSLQLVLSQMASGSSANASAACRASPMAVRAHCGVARGQTARRRDADAIAQRRPGEAEPVGDRRRRPRRPLRPPAAGVGVLDETTPSTTTRPESTNSAIASRSAACSVPASTATALILLCCNTFHGRSGHSSALTPPRPPRPRRCRASRWPASLRSRPPG